MPKAQDASTWINPPLIKAPVGVSPRVSTLPGRRDGSRPSGPLPPQFTLTATSDSITATITQSNGATSYEIRVDSGAAVSGLTVTGLNSEQSYYVQIRGINANGTSDWSTAVSKSTLDAYTPPPPTTSTGDLIWEADLNNQPDWEVQFAGQRYKYVNDSSEDGSAGYPAADNIPPSFDFYYTGAEWHPNGDRNGDFVYPETQPNVQINNSLGNHLSPTGKSLILYDQSYGTSSGWGSDGVLMKQLDQDYNEFYVEFYMRMQPDWVWEDVLEGSGQSTIKVCRFGRFFGGDSDERFAFFGSGKFAHWTVFNVQSWSTPSNYAQLKVQRWQNPWDMQPDQTWEVDDEWVPVNEKFGDGEWHKFNLQLKINSAAGTADGIYRVWFDDRLQFEDLEFEWNTLPEDNGKGFNCISFGGNADNIPYAHEDRFTHLHEQWWQLAGMKVWHGVPGG